MTLTEADKTRIEEEEHYREQVKGGLGNDGNKPKKGKGCLTVFLIFIILGVMGSLFSKPSTTTNTNSTSSKTEEEVKLEEKNRQDKINTLGATFCRERTGGVRAVNFSTFIEMYEKKGETITLKATTAAPTQENCNKVAGICLTLLK